MQTIGIIANPASGKDVRRLVARASVFDNQEKQAIVRRALSGIVAATAGHCRIAYLDDRHGITRNALDDAGGLNAEAVPAARTASSLDTLTAARELAGRQACVVLTLGGDGTNRDVARGWRDAPVIPISTGTNNVFPGLIEATVAGAAAGLIAHGVVTIDELARPSKIVSVDIDGEKEDLALIDAVLSSERFVGARALLDPEALRTLVLTRAVPSAVGMTALGGLLSPLTDAADGGLVVELGSGPATLSAPIAPGYYRSVHVTDHRPLALGEVVRVEGPGVLAFDGERTRTLAPGQSARLKVLRGGPRVVDVELCLRLAAERGAFRCDDGAAPDTPALAGHHR